MKKQSLDLNISFIYLLGLLIVLVFYFFSMRIDFHPDEAIYFQAIPLQLRNDTGLFWHGYYTLVTSIFGNSPQGARLASSILGGGTFIVVAFIFKTTLHNFNTTRIVLLGLIFLLSYEAIFLFIRVRPEASWWFVGTLMLYRMIAYEKQPTKLNLFFLLFTLFLVPLNHKVSWFICFAVMGYSFLFLFYTRKIKFAFLIIGTVVTGILFNTIFTAMLLHTDIYNRLLVILQTGDAAKESVINLLIKIFWDGPLFLNDMAQNENLYQKLFQLNGPWVSHAFVSASLLLSMLILPFFAVGKVQRYVLTFPLLSFILFLLAGYYNPTYAAGYSLFIVLTLYYLILQSSNLKVKRLLAILVVLSVFNGCSFIITRIVNHNEATYFKQEREVHEFLSNSNVRSVAISQRFLPATAGLDVKIFSLYQDEIPKNVDVIVADGYDVLMYGFIPDLEQKKQKLYAIEQNMSIAIHEEHPVYLNDTMFISDQNSSQLRASSWFFRNSTNYSLTIYVRREQE